MRRSCSGLTGRRGIFVRRTTIRGHCMSGNNKKQETLQTGTGSGSCNIPRSLGLLIRGCSPCRDQRRMRKRRSVSAFVCGVRDVTGNEEVHPDLGLSRLGDDGKLTPEERQWPSRQRPLFYSVVPWPTHRQGLSKTFLHPMPSS